MKIILVTPSYYPAINYGGPTVAIKSLCENMFAAGCSIEVFTTNAFGSKTVEFDFQLLNGVPISYFKRVIGDPFNLSITLLARLCFLKVDQTIFHIHSWWNLTSILSLLICRIKGNKVLLTPHGTLTGYSFKSKHKFIKGIFRKYFAKILFKKVYFHFTSKFEYTEFTKNLYNCEHVIIPNYIDINKKSQIVKKLSNINSLLFVGRIHPVKNLEQLLLGLSYINSKWTLDIYGEGEIHYVNNLLKFCKKLKILNRVKFCGWIDNDKLIEIYDRYDLFVMPSIGENFSLSVLEALCNNLLVLVSCDVGLKDYVEEKNIGWSYNGTLEDLIFVLNEIFMADRHLIQLKQEKLDQVVFDFLPITISNQYISYYTLIVNEA